MPAKVALWLYFGLPFVALWVITGLMGLGDGPALGVSFVGAAFVGLFWSSQTRR